MNTMISLLFICLILTLITCDRAGLGGFEKDSFASNDLHVDKSWKTVENEFFKYTGQNNKDILLYRIAIYKQLVNGMNYKIFFAAQDRTKNEVKYYDYLVSTGSANAADPFHFEVISTKELPKASPIPINNAKWGKINQLAANFVNAANNKVNYVNTVNSSETMFAGSHIHLVVGQSKKTKKTDSYLVYEDEEGNFEVIAELR